MINHYIHQIWFQGSDRVPQNFDVCRTSWIDNHPNWYYRIWDEKSLLSLLEGYRNLIPMYKRLTTMIQKVHFFQYILLHRFGGVVVQMDIQCYENITKLLSREQTESGQDKSEKIDYDLVFIENRKNRRNTPLMMGFMAGSAGHPFWVKIMAEMLLESYVPRKMFELYDVYIHRTSGSNLLTSVFREQKPKNTLVLPFICISAPTGFCSFKMWSRGNFQVKKRNEKLKKHHTNGGIMVDQHFHDWSKSRNIYSVMILVIFIVLSSVLIRVVILRNGKPTSKQEMITAQYTRVL
jgi:mannosyltransferase OCH1-like enzyme